MNCPSCHRPVAMARPRCLYCGAALPSATVEAAQAAAAEAPEAPPKSDRVLLIVDMTGAEARAVSRALGLSAFEAAQRVRRGGPQIVRIADAAAASHEAERIAKEGLRVERVAEAAALEAARPGARGRRAPRRRRPRPARERWKAPARAGRRRPRRQGTDHARVPDPRSQEGVRNRGAGAGIPLPRPPPLGPAPRGAGPRGLRVPDRRAPVVAPAPDRVDRGDHPRGAGGRRLPPDPSGARSRRKRTRAAGSGPPRRSAGRHRGKKDDGRVVLDNIAQFRFYSGWRGILERQRKSSP